MTSEDAPTPVTVELHVRSLAPQGGRDQQESAIERLDRLATDGRIDEFSVDVWGQQVSLSTASARTDAGRAVLDRVEAFREWADETGRSVESFFETRRVASEITDQQYVSLVLPTLTLAEYRDGDLSFVAPCSDGGTVTTVTDRIDGYESGDVSPMDTNRSGLDAEPVVLAEEAEE
jgi:hypothetical protein